VQAIVNARYINKCLAFGFDIKKTKLGDVLDVNREYFRDATIHELSIKLTQFLWRKLLPAERDNADDALNDAAFELLTGDDYKLAERILEYGLVHTKSENDLLRRMLAVNYANAIKLDGDKPRAEKELEKFDWSATNLAFQISVAAVKDNLNEVVKLMPTAVKSNELSEAALRRWPVFKIMRGQKPFQDKFKDIFGKDFISVATLAPEPPLTGPIEAAKLADSSKDSVANKKTKATRH